MARVLYVFPHSVFSRRTQLALAHKGLDVELRDARGDEVAYAEARKLSPQGTMPVLVDDGRALGDSTAIAHYLDHAYDDRPRLWPRGGSDAADAFAIASLVDVTVNTLADMGTRYWPLRNDPAWKDVLAERMRRAQGAIDEVAARATKPILAGSEWGAAEIWALSMTRWVKGMPARAPSSPLVAQVLSLGLRLPERLVAWAEGHDARPEVRAIYA
jgi:glutathione S-transferase